MFLENIYSGAEKLKYFINSREFCSNKTLIATTFEVSVTKFLIPSG